MKAENRRKKVVDASDLDNTTRIYIYVCIAIACFVFYGNTLKLDYALDDVIAITGNQFTKAGLKGIPDIMTTDLFTGLNGKDNTNVTGGRYRPLSLVSFAIEYQFFGLKPGISHFINILILLFTSLIFLRVFWKLFVLKGIPPDAKSWFISIPFLAVMFFIGHPVHTEAVANIKGRDELLSLFFVLLTMKLILRYFENNKFYYQVFIGVSFFLALLSKENAITFLIVIPLMLWFFTKYYFKDYVRIFIPLIISTLLFLLLRQWVIGHNTPGGLENDLMNNPFVEMNLMQKLATIFYTLGLYLKLLVFPHPLTYDYYPYHIPIIAWNDFRAIISLLLYFALLIFAAFNFRKKGILTFTILYYFITISLVSNLLFPIGTFMNERFLYIPSVGFCLGLAWGISHGLSLAVKNKALSTKLILLFSLVILTLYAVKTISRNSDWYDSYTLFTTDVKVSVNSAKGNALAGEYLIKKALTSNDANTRDSLLRQSIKYQQRAIQVYPKQIIALFNLASAYYQYNKNYDTILTIYSTILNYLPDNPKVYQNFLMIMNPYKDSEHKIELLKRLNNINPRRFDVNTTLGILYLDSKKDPVSAIPFLQAAADANPSDFATWNNLGLAFSMSKDWNKAKIAFEAAEQINPNDIKLMKNLAAVCQNAGLPDKVKIYLERAKKLEQNIAR
jgi:tetratricopeptide (TPR) repeat protein